MPDPRKQAQFVEQLYRYRGGLTDFTTAVISLIKRLCEAELEDTNDNEYLLKQSYDRRKWPFPSDAFKKKRTF